MEHSSPIRAVIGVSFRAPKTLYVKRSDNMENYPGVWSLPSIQYKPEELPDPLDLDSATKIFARMSHERFVGTPVKVQQYLTAGSSDLNPMQRMVELVLYRISFVKDSPLLNEWYYTESAWLTQHEFALKTVLAPLPCGLCTKLWQQYEEENAISRAPA